MSSIRYSLFRSIAAGVVNAQDRKPGHKVFVVTVTETVTHRAKVEATDEKNAWQKFVLSQFIERFRQVKSEMSEISVK